ncbi:hypothetical protein BD410DRAFT_810450, partial [Rickenella mellea]
MMRPAKRKKDPPTSGHVFTPTLDDWQDESTIVQSTVERPSDDGRRVYRNAHPVPLPPLATEGVHTWNVTQQDVEMDDAVPCADEWDWGMPVDGTDLNEGDAQEIASGTEKRKRYATSDDPMREWAPLRDKYLQEFLRLDGRREFASTTCS